MGLISPETKPVANERMTRDIQGELKRYEREARQLQRRLKQVKQEQNRQQQQAEFIKEGAAEFIKDQLGVDKRHSRPVLNAASEGQQQNQLQGLEREFDQWLSEMKQFVSTISEKTKTNRQNSDKLLRKFNRVERKVKLETKLKHALSVVRELQNMDLVYNDELEQRDQRSQQSQSRDNGETSSQSEHPVADMGIEEIVERGETQAIEFKRAMPGTARSLAAEIVALSTAKGGVVVLGVADDGSVVGLSDVDDVEERVANLVRKTVDPPMNPDIEKRTIDGKDVLVVEVSPFQESPHSVDGTFYKRVGTTKQKLTGADLKELVS